MARLNFKELRATVSTLHDSVQLLVWVIGGVSIAVALLTGVQLLPDMPEIALSLPDPREWISLEHPLYRWMFMVLGLIAAFSALFAVGSWLAERGAAVRGELALFAAALTALLALLIARGLTEIAFNEGWALTLPEFEPGWTWLKALFADTLGQWIVGPWRWGAAGAYLFVVIWVLTSLSNDTSGTGSFWFFVLVVIPAAFVAWVLVAWPLLRLTTNIVFYLALGCALFYVAHYGDQRTASRSWLAWAVALVWCGYAFVEATGGAAA
jgi:hypothetical protein